MSELRTAFLSALSRSERRVVEQLLGQPQVSPDNLRQELDSYLKGLEEFAQTDEFVDLQTALDVANRCRRLLGKWASDHGADAYPIVQAAVRYFLLDEDAEGDRASPIGFDDDARVVAAAEKVLANETLGD